MRFVISHIKKRLKKLFDKVVGYIKQRYRYRTRYWYAHYFRCAKIQRNTILYQAYRNNIMAGNPYAIFRELIDRPEYKDYLHIWVYTAERNMRDDTFQKYSSMPNVIYVKKSDVRSYAKYLASCQFLVSNSALPSYWIKKNGQTYINTWHGVPLKTLGRDAKDRSNASITNAQRNFFLCDYMVMPNRYTIERMIAAYDLENMISGQILDAGYPRTDLVINTDKTHILGLLEEKLGTSLEHKKVVLYAPTFRSVKGKSINTSRELGKYMEALLNILPAEYELVFKVHNMMASFFRHNSKMKSRLIFDEIETNELLSVTDVLITDYSSIFFDFLCRKKPILFFTYDRQEYADGRGLYLPLEELPGALCETVEDIGENFLKIQDGNYHYQDNFDRFLHKFAYHDDGEAARRVVDIIFGKKSEMTPYIYQVHPVKDRILVVSGRLGELENKWECSRTLRGLDCEKNTVILFAPDALRHTGEWENISKAIQIVDIGDGFLFTFSEKIKEKIFHIQPHKRTFFARQYTKYFGDLHFSKIINLAGEQTAWRAVLEPNCSEYVSVPKTKDIEQRKELCAAVGHKMTVLFIAAFDSVNYVYVNLIQELEKQNYHPILVVWNKEDDTQNKMFLANQISFLDINEFDAAELDEVDFVITTPFQYAKGRELWKQIQRRRIFCISFATLFSSIAMRVYTDLIFTMGTSKFQEFEENGCHYRMVSAGNPQYDDLIAAVGKNPPIEPSQIKRVLFVDQGGYPFGVEGKQLLGQVLLAMANQHPDKQFVVKPRYLPREMEGPVLHRPSEHLYDFIPNPPENLTLLSEPTILEDMLGDFDAMVTMWSTAYLDAALRNMPIILIRGLPSQEVMDVRVQRIEEAFDRLEKTGCVVDYQDILKGSLEFHYVSDAYLKEEVENVGRPCAPEIVNALEDIYEQWILPKKRPREVFQTDIQTFRKELPTMETVELNSDLYRQRRTFLSFLNAKVQDLAFRNRAMAKPFNMKPIQKYWYFSPSRSLNKVQRKWLNLKVRLTIEMVERKYFCSPQIKTEADPIRLDYYYDWLLRRKKYKKLMSFSNPNAYPETVAFYRSIGYIFQQDYRNAAREFASYYNHVKALRVKPIQKDRIINFDYLPNGMKCADFFEALYRMKEYSVLKDLAKRKCFNVYMRTYYLLKVLRDENLTEELTEEYERFFISRRRSSKPKNGSKRKTQLDYYLGCIEIGEAFYSAHVHQECIADQQGGSNV